MTPDEEQIINEAAQKLRTSSSTKDESILLLTQLLDRTFTVESAGAAAGGGAGNQTLTLGPTAAAAPRTDETFTVEQAAAAGGNATFTVQTPANNQTFTVLPAAVNNQTFTVEPGAVNNQTFTVDTNPLPGAGPGPVCSSPIQPGRLVNYIPSPSPSPISTGCPASILRPFGNPGNARRRVTFNDSSVGSNMGWSSSSGVTGYPNRMFTGSNYQDAMPTSLDSASFGRIWTAPPRPGSSGRHSQLRNWMQSSASSSTGSGTIPGTATFADMNSSRVESSNERSSSTASAVYCPHCGHPLNMNVNIQAPVNTSNSSVQNLRIRVNFFDDSDSGSANSNSGISAQGSMGSNNPMGVNCPNCRQRIHLRMNIRQNLANSSDSEQEYQVQIGLLAHPESSCANSSNSSSNRSQYVVYNCGDCPRPSSQPNPKSKGDKS